MYRMLAIHASAPKAILYSLSLSIAPFLSHTFILSLKHTHISFRINLKQKM